METPHETVWLGVRGWHRPRTRWLVLTGLVVAVAAAVSAAVLWLDSYSPLRFDGGVSYGGNVGDLPTARVMPGLGKDVIYVSMNEPGYVAFGFDVANTGRVPVTVAGDTGEPGPLRLSGMGRNSERDAPGARVYPDIVPFAAVEIAPGDKRYLSFRVQIDKPCAANYAPGSMMGIDTVGLRYRYVGVFERDVRVEMPFLVGIVCGDLPKPYPAS